ncbi:MAG: hypothetical protein RJA10_3353 [Pseudomonadota bacterium]|jgi:hypothetical protein
MTNRFEPRTVPTASRRALLAALTLASLAPTGAAQADPMRPLVPPAKPQATAGAPPVPAAKAADTAPPLGRLVAIRQDSQGRMQALIGERWVGVGDTLAHTSVTAIAPNQVELSNGKSRSTLHLLPPLHASNEPGPSQPPQRAVPALPERATLTTAALSAATTAPASNARPSGSPNR